MRSAGEGMPACVKFRITNADIPGSRHAIEFTATKGFIYFSLFMAILSAFIFITGLLGGGLDNLFSAFERLEHTDAALMTLFGLGCFWLFFLLFVFLYFIRHLLLSVKRLEGLAGQSRDPDSSEAEGSEH